MPGQKTYGPFTGSVKVLVLTASMLLTGGSWGQTPYLGIGLYNEMSYRTWMITLDAGLVVNPGSRIELGGEMTAYKFFDEDYSSVGIGIGPLLKVKSLHRNNFKLFLFMKGGIVYMFPEFPNQALNFNFSGGPSFERTIFNDKTLSLYAGYYHLSNGKSKGEAYNAAWDGFGCRIGFGF